MSAPPPRCPICQAAPATAKHAPFCSARCQLIDLGNWLGERYAVPTTEDEGGGGDLRGTPPPDEERDVSHSKGSR